MSSFEFIRDTITEEIMKHDNDTVNTLIQKNSIRVDIEAGFLKGVWHIDDDEVASNMFIRDEKQNDLVDLNILTKDLNRMKNYSWMLNTMQGRLKG